MGEVPYEFLKKLKLKNEAAREFLAEFMGTFILIIFGDAALATTVLDNKGVPDLGVANWSWGVAVMLGIATCGGLTGGHINPAVTVALATLGKFPWRKVPHFLLAQYFGAFTASAVLFAVYIDALDNFDPNRSVTGPTATAFIWATYPKAYVSIVNCFFDQVVGTGLLMFNVLAIIDQKNMNFSKGIQVILIGFMISALCFCYGLNCMAALNPARDFTTRLFTAIAGYGGEVFWHRQYFWIGIVPVHMGAILGGWIYYLAIELHWPDTTDGGKKKPLNEKIRQSDSRSESKDELEL